MALYFEDTRCAIRTSPIGWSQHQHLRLMRTQHLAQSAWPLLHWEHINEHDVCAKCCVPINRKCWCCDWPIGDVLVPHHVPSKGSVITAGSRLPTYTFSKIKFFSTRWFLDIEKSVRLKLKGVKIIRRYRDLFQLIYLGFSDWELMWFCIVVHRHLSAAVKYKRSSVAIGVLVTLCLLYHSSF